MEQECLADHEVLKNGSLKLVKGQDGGYLIMRATAPNMEDYLDSHYSWLLKVDSLSNQEWFQEYPYYDPTSYYLIQQGVFDIEATADGGYVMCANLVHFGLGDAPDYRSWLVKIDACGYTEWSGCEEVVGVGELEMQPKISVWPNPTSEVLHLSNDRPKRISKVEMYDVSGI